jgi:hypothetical protein
MALAGKRFGCGRRAFGQRLSLSWHHTRSFWRRSRVECEQSCGSFARPTVSSVTGTAQTAPINAALAFPDCRPWFSKAACCKQ